MRCRRSALVMSLCGWALLVPGCTWFGGEEPEEVSDDPFPLTRIDEEVRLVKVWGVNIGEGVKKRYDRLPPAIDDNRIFAASFDGEIVALELDSGRMIWETSVADVLGVDPDDVVVSAGVGVGEGLAVVGASTGDLIALNQSDGSVAWQAKTTSEVLSSPQINESVVVAQSIDGRVTGFDPISGEREWNYSALVPALTLRGTSTPLMGIDYVVCSFANGKVVLLDTARGIPRWEQRLAVAQGSSELERLIDADGEMAISGASVYASSYQGSLAAIGLADGRIRWQREASSHVGVGEGFGNVYLALDNSRIIAIDTESSRDVWEVDALTNREITTPIAIGNHVAVADVEGYVHLIAQSDGRFTGRIKLDGKGIRTRPVVDGNRLYVLGNSGRLTALEVR